MGRSYIGIGSNIDNPIEQVRRAIDHLRSYGEVIAVSSLYRGTPWGTVKDQPEFVNCVVLLQTHYSPHELLLKVKMAERELGRLPSVRWGPRSIDFDILTYDDERINDPDFKVPHPHMHERAFVLVPLAEIDSGYAGMRDALPQAERDSVRVASSEPEL